MIVAGMGAGSLSRDARRAVRELVFRGIRIVAERPVSGRAAMLALAAADPEIAAQFDGTPHGPGERRDDDVAAPVGVVPRWIESQLSPVRIVKVAISGEGQAIGQ